MLRGCTITLGQNGLPMHASRADASEFARCSDVEAQWRTYQHEQRARVGWEQYTDCIEGALLLADLRSPATQCLLCNWFNEYSRWAASLNQYLSTCTPQKRRARGDCTDS